MATPSARMTINISDYLHKRLKYQAFMHDITMTQILERGAESLVEYLEADDSTVSQAPRDESTHVTVSTSITADQAELFDQLLTQRGDTAHEVLERAIVAYLARIDNPRSYPARRF